jgi:hypothetical protein
MLREACGVVTARFLHVLAPWPKRPRTRGIVSAVWPFDGR